MAIRPYTRSMAAPLLDGGSMADPLLPTPMAAPHPGGAEN